MGIAAFLVFFPILAPLMGLVGIFGAGPMQNIFTIASAVILLGPVMLIVLIGTLIVNPTGFPEFLQMVNQFFSDIFAGNF